MKPWRVLYLLLFCSATCIAQSFDTNCYVKYNDKLIVSLYQSYRTYNIQFKQLLTNADSGISAMDYYADANNVSGIEFNYDKFGFSLGYKSEPPRDHTKKGKTYYSNWAFSFGGNKWILETSYRRFKGFYNLNTSLQDTGYSPDKPYYNDPNLVNTSLKGKFIYFSNNKQFSYKSSYACSYRQLKWAGTGILTGNVYYANIQTDTSFFAKQVQEHYGSLYNLNGLSTTGLSAGAGISANFVFFKRAFFNATLIAGLESQWRRYSHFGASSYLMHYISGMGEVRGSLGYNGKRFFAMFTTFIDVSSMKSGLMDVTYKFISGYFQFGYRFNMKTPSFYKKFQDTKIYSYF